MNELIIKFEDAVSNGNREDIINSVINICNHNSSKLDVASQEKIMGIILNINNFKTEAAIMKKFILHFIGFIFSSGFHTWVERSNADHYDCLYYEKLYQEFGFNCIKN